MGKRIFFLIVLMMLAAPLLPACGPSQAAVERPPLRVEYALWEGDYTLLIAQEKGFFEKHGVKVDAIYYPTFSRALPDMASNRLDAGLFAMENLLYMDAVSDVRGVAVSDSGGPAYIVARADVNAPADLKGKKIGAITSSYSELIVREMFKSAGVSLNDVTLVNTDPENVTDQIASGVIDAGYVWTPLQQRAVAAGQKILYNRETNKSANPNMIVFRDEVIQQRPEDVRAFLAAWFEALNYRQSNPTECDAIIARVTGLPVKDIRISGTVQIYTLEDNLRLFDRKAAGSASIDQAADANLQFMMNTGLVTFPPALEKILDPSFLK